MKDYNYPGVRPALRATERAPDLAVLESESGEQLRLPGAYIAKMSMAPAATDVAAYLASTALGVEAQTIDEFDGQPDYPRQVMITAAADSMVGDIVLNGIDFFGEEITETISMADDGDTEYESTLMYRELTSVEIPAATAPGDAIEIGSTEAINLPFIAGENTILLVTHDGVIDTEYSYNQDDDYDECWFAPTSALDAKTINIYFINK
jgi:hypothetical protein